MTTLPHHEENKENEEEELDQEEIINEREVSLKGKKTSLMKGEKSLFDELNADVDSENLFT